MLSEDFEVISTGGHSPPVLASRRTMRVRLRVKPPRRIFSSKIWVKKWYENVLGYIPEAYKRRPPIYVAHTIWKQYHPAVGEE